ncbi:MAG: flagellar motor stator protein MotA [Desulfobacteraceae bacterium]|nr:flagellar motor stator protein MotA [Desulfobacteraceae bacterium]
MFVGIGVAVVLIAVLGGFTLEHGNVALLWQPLEMMIIFGSALGGLFISSPSHVVKSVFKDLSKVFSSSGINKERYLALLMLLNSIFYKIKKEGLITIEDDVDNPGKSKLFQVHQAIMADPEVSVFICDTIRTMITANYPPHEMEALMEIDLETNHHERMESSHAVEKVADSLPGLGIVAAVLGIVLTMNDLGQPAEILGHHIGAALCGTFLGVLACYGFIGPLAVTLAHRATERQTYMNVIKTGLLAAYASDFMVPFAIESARRSIPAGECPSFAEVDVAIKKWKAKS